ncbi:hypothetical protein SAMN06297387_11221 [Streptomyces zhaozhouensis]|uniref:Uncharacterized protein n=1 Tax=Streptomyces zhaozhouensis TaxID=1300267 RepID=A0A286DYB6_9ACTN|nr:hypothetical protein SAMN06297387_11221 [Streptomyces zhaozhouensis]
MTRDMEKPGAATPGVLGDHLAGGSGVSVPPRRAARQQLAANPFGLSLAEVRAEAARCAARGWQLWEIRTRFYPEGGEPR